MSAEPSVHLGEYCCKLIPEVQGADKYMVSVSLELWPSPALYSHLLEPPAG